MNILIIGSGGREHAIAWAVAKSPKAGRIYCAPGNAGIAQVAECVPIGAMEFEKLAAFAKEHAVDLTIVGMDDPLVGGIVDVFESEGLRIFGPRKNAAILEGSKAFSKDLMKKYGIPTADYVTVHSAQEAREYLERASYPIVLKADGLALGKGVLICNTREEALDGVKEIMEDRRFGDSGNTTRGPAMGTRARIRAEWATFPRAHSIQRISSGIVKSISISPRWMRWLRKAGRLRA